MAQKRRVSPHLPHRTVILRDTDVCSDLEFLEFQLRKIPYRTFPGISRKGVERWTALSWMVQPVSMFLY